MGFVSSKMKGASTSNEDTSNESAPTARAPPSMTEAEVHHLIAVEKRDMMILHGKVYDVTPFTASHPGGVAAIRGAAGEESGDTFDRIHGASARQTLATFFIANLFSPPAALDEAAVQGMAASGRAVLILHGVVVDVTAFVSSHPGGEAAITKRAGNEVGDLFDRIHSKSTKEMVKRYTIGHLPAAAAKPTAAPKLESAPHEAVLLCSEAVAEDVRYLTLSSPARLPLLPGGHIDVCLPAPDGSARGWRPYSPFLCADTSFTLAVRRYAGGAASGHLHALAPGARLRYRGPLPPAWRAAADAFFLSSPAPRRVLLVAGGTGVAPLYAIAADLLAEHAACVTLVGGFRSPAALLLHAELVALAASFGDRYSLQYVFSRATAAPEMAEVEKVHFGRFDVNVARQLRPAVTAVICGPASFVDTVAKAIVDGGVCAAGQVHVL